MTNIWPFTTKTTENLLFCCFSKIVIVTSSAKISPREIFKNASSAKISPQEMLEFCGWAPPRKLISAKIYPIKVRYFRFTNPRISNKVRYTWFFRTFWRSMESTSQLPYVLICQFTVYFPTSELCYKCFSCNDIFFMTLGLRSFAVRCITYGNNVWKLSFVFISSHFRYLFVRCSYDFWWR